MSERVVPAADRRRRRPTKQGVVLSEELIVETALRLIEEHGTEALSVRRLGRALGADPSSLYRYFRHTDDLMLAVADELIGRTLRTWRPSGDWLADLRDLGLRVHAGALAHPRAAVLSSYRVTGRVYEIQAVEAILGVLRGAGFPDVEAVRIYHAYVDQALAFGALDSANTALPQCGPRGGDGRMAGDVRAVARRHASAHRGHGPPPRGHHAAQLLPGRPGSAAQRGGGAARRDSCGGGGLRPLSASGARLPVSGAWLSTRRAASY